MGQLAKLEIKFYQPNHPIHLQHITLLLSTESHILNMQIKNIPYLIG